MTIAFPVFTATAKLSSSRHLLGRVIFIAGIALYSFVLARTAWVGEDAYITLRVVDNFVNGYGPVWNTDERVQAFTHPLWMLVLSGFYAVTHEAHLTTLAVSMALSLFTAGLILWEAKEKPQIALPVALAIIGSKAFVDYSTSGLENPLTHALVAIFIVLYVRDRQGPQPTRIMKLCLVAGLAALNRTDIALMVLPGVIERIVQHSRWPDRLKALLLVGAPLIVWMAFSTFYYGFPLPNTYYAKQAAGIPRVQYLERGLEYIANIITHDPLTAFVIATGVIGSVIARERRRLWPITTGVALYAACVIWLGGDFMQGRFFSALFVAGILLVLYSSRQTPAEQWPVSLTATVAVFLFGLAAQPVPNLLSNQNYPRPFFTLSMTIVDERGFYYWAAGLLPVLNGEGLSQMPWVQQGMKSRQVEARVHVFTEIGFRGYFAGPKVKIIDSYGLADAFLARLPYRGGSDWRIGHIWRANPPGYLETRVSGENRLRNESLRHLYDELDLITRGPLWSAERLLAIVQFNLHPLAISASDLDGPVEDLTFEQFAQGIYHIGSQGLRIFLPANQEKLPETLLLRSDAGTGYTLLFQDGDILRAAIEFPAYTDRPADEPVVHHLVPDLGAIGRYNTLRLVPQKPGPTSVAGLLHIIPDPFLARTGIPKVYRITLSSTVGLSAFSQPRTWVEGRRMVGIWETDKARDLTLVFSLLPFCADGGMQRAVVKVNREIMASHTWREQECTQSWSAQLLIPATVVRPGVNTIEIESDFAFQASPRAGITARYPSIAIETLKVVSPSAK